MSSLLRTRLLILHAIVLVVLVAAIARFSFVLTPGYTDLVPGMMGLVGIVLVELIYLFWRTPK